MSDLLKKINEIRGMSAKQSKELIESGVKKLSDLTSPLYVDKLPMETQYELKYNPGTNFTWDYVHSIVSHLPIGMFPAGSYRRKAPYIGDIDIVTTKPLKEATDEMRLMYAEGRLPFEIMGEYASGDRKRSMIIRPTTNNRIVGEGNKSKYMRMDLFKTTDEELPFAMLHWTGSKSFNIRVRAHAKKKGYKLNQYGLFNKAGNKIKASTEKEILSAIGVTYKPPELRNG